MPKVEYLQMSMTSVLKHMRKMNSSMKTKKLAFKNMKTISSSMERDLISPMLKSPSMPKTMKLKFITAPKDPVALAIMSSLEKLTFIAHSFSPQ